MSLSCRSHPAAPPAPSTAHGLTLQIATGGGRRDVRMSGRLVAGAGAAHPAWAALGREIGRDLVLDLSGVSAIDAAGVGRLLDTRARLGTRGARLTVRAMSPRVRRTLDLLGVSPHLVTAGPAAVRRAAAAPMHEAASCGCGC